MVVEEPETVGVLAAEALDGRIVQESKAFRIAVVSDVRELDGACDRVRDSARRADFERLARILDQRAYRRDHRLRAADRSQIVGGSGGVLQDVV